MNPSSQVQCCKVVWPGAKDHFDSKNSLFDVTSNKCKGSYFSTTVDKVVVYRLRILLIRFMLKNDNELSNVTLTFQVINCFLSLSVTISCFFFCSPDPILDRFSLLRGSFTPLAKDQFLGEAFKFSSVCFL